MNYLKLVLIIFVTFCSLLLHAGKRQKNVVLLLFDDLRYDSFGFSGGKANTPNIDGFAAKSIRFQNAMTTTGLCSPSRAALFTGRWGHRTGLDDNIDLWHSKNRGLVSDETTIYEWALDKNYRIGYFGKWHLGPFGPETRGVKHTSGSKIGGGNKHAYVPVKENKRIKEYYAEENKNSEKELYYKTLSGSYKETGLNQKVTNGIAFLNRAAKSDSSFFLTISFNQPHPPYKIPEPYASMYDPGLIELPESFHDDLYAKPLAQSQILWPWHDTGHMSDTDWRKTIARYYGAVSMIDRAVGDLLQALKNNDQLGNTMIIIVGDQGSMIGEHGLYDKGPYSYDELMRIPMIVKIPGKKQRDIHRQVSLLDLNQTLVEWMEVLPQKENIDSRSLFPLINNGNEGWNYEDIAFYHYEWYNGSWFGVRTIRTPGWKYCWYPSDVDEMYNLKNDPKEQVNLYEKQNYHSKSMELKTKLLNHLAEIKDPLHHWLKNELEQE